MTHTPRFLPLCTLLTALAAIASPAAAETDKYRLAWRDDPATTVVIAWNQVDGSDPVVRYDTLDRGDDAEAYAHTAKPHHDLRYRGMHSHFVRLEGLKPDTAYYFLIQDSNSKSRRLWFRTAPDKPQAFTFIAGGDSRSNAEPRRDGNRIVAKLRPLFISHGGDYMGSGTSAEWQQWFDEWQLTISPDGRIYPLVPAHGNHENKDMLMVHKLFDTPHPDMYYAMDVGGRLMRLYTLNTEIHGKPWDQQLQWLTADLARHPKRTWKMMQYHKPMRPHTKRKSEGRRHIQDWAPLFYKFGVDLAIECDTHMVKRTYPLRPHDGPEAFESFVRDDKRGTVFIGEGSWGAPKRPADDDKPWTMASDSFYQFKWIHVTPEHIDIRSVRFENIENIESVSDDDPTAVPEGLKLWEPPTGTVLRLPFDPESPTFRKPAPWTEALAFGSTWRYHDGGDRPGADWHAPDHDDAKWKRGPAPLGYGDDGEKTVLDFGGDPKNKHAAYYFRTSFEARGFDPAKIGPLKIDVRADDGFIAYLNGREIGRFNMPDGPATAETFASGGVGDASTTTLDVDPKLLREGVNHLAVEVHQRSGGSSDIALDAQVRYQSR